jgi:hypothetical protein
MAARLQARKNAPIGEKQQSVPIEAQRQVPSPSRSPNASKLSSDGAGSLPSSTGRSNGLSFGTVKPGSDVEGTNTGLHTRLKGLGKEASNASSQPQSLSKQERAHNKTVIRSKRRSRPSQLTRTPLPQATRCLKNGRTSNRAARRPKQKLSHDATTT